MEFDVIVVGAGPAGLAFAIRLKQLCHQNDLDYSICLLEKGAAVGSHVLSGAVLEPRALDELLPQWREMDAPITRTVTDDRFLYLGKKRAWQLPTPPQMNNEGNYIVSLGRVCGWLASHAESLGVEIYPGFAASELLIDENKKIIGVKSGDMGINKDGSKSDKFQAGMELTAKQIVLAEGCRGYLSEKLIAQYNLRENSNVQTYGLGIKEIWEVDSPLYSAGKVVHTIGWPLDRKTYGGSFMYHNDDNQVAVGFVVGLDYQNPSLSPFHEMQRFKTHPAIKPLFEGGKRIAYGARTLIEGGAQSIPQLSVPGALIVGDSAGFLNVPKIKGTHTAMKSGMIAAEAVFTQLNENETTNEYPQMLKDSWVHKELHEVRNIRPAFQNGLWRGLCYAAFDTYVLRGNAPWTFKNHADHLQTKFVSDVKKIDYPKPDGTITFDRLSSVHLSNVYHEENQPSHLILEDPEKEVPINIVKFGGPEQYYCPAAVYEILQNEKDESYLQINAQNCVHCKCCDIKDPTQNIKWVPPEGGGGPNYSDM